MAFPETTITINDLDDSINVLSMCLTFFSAKDLQDAQVSFRNVQPSALTAEIEKVLTKQKYILGDHLMQAHLGASDDEEDYDDLDDQDDLEEPQEGSESLPGAPEGELSPEPFGSFKEPKQKGRRLTKAQVAAGTNEE